MHWFRKGEKLVQIVCVLPLWTIQRFLSQWRNNLFAVATLQTVVKSKEMEDLTLVKCTDEMV